MKLTASAVRAEAPDARALVAALQADLHDWVPRCVIATLESLERSRMAARAADERVAIGAALNAMQARRQAWGGQLLAGLHAALDEDLAQSVAPSAAPRAEVDFEPLSLSLMAEDVVDEEIAVSRLVQLVESGAEVALRELAARCSGLRGWSEVSPDAHPLRPALVGRALRSTVAGFGLPPAQRVALLRELSTAFGQALPAVYTRELELLRGWGVESARFKLRQNETGGRAAEPTRSGGAGATGAPMLSFGAVSQRQAPGSARSGFSAGMGPAQTQALQHLATPEGMQQLLAVLVSRTTLNPGTRELIRRLDGPARRLAETEPQLWTAADHPLWRLLDRLVSAGAVHDEMDSSRPGPVGDALERAVRALEEANPPGSADCEVALQQVDTAVTDLLDQQAGQIEAQAQGMARQGERDDEARRLREQLVLQVRSSQAPPALNRFLLGPWAQVLTHSAQAHGGSSTQVQLQVELVDQLFELVNRSEGSRLSLRKLTQGLTHARLGLSESGFDADRVEAEVESLKRVLVDPWTRAANDPDLEVDPWTGADSPAFAATQPMDADEGLGLHEALPTVPLDTLGPDDSDGEGGARSEGWLDALPVGSFCRMHLMGQWMNTRLLWCSDNRGMYVFASRHGGRMHTLSRRSLHKLRAAGLAASIESGQFVAQAMTELASH